MENSLIVFANRLSVPVLLERLLFAALLVFLCYGPFMAMARWAAGKLVTLRPPESMSALNAKQMLMAPLWQLAVVALYLPVSRATGLSLKSLITTSFQWRMLPCGLLLGIGQGSVALLLAIYLLRVAAPLRRRQIGSELLLEYRTLGQSGWMRTFYDIFQAVPFPLSFLIVMMPLLAEELLFRAMLLPIFKGTPPMIAVMLSTALFMVVQLFRLPSWYQGIAPVIGAVVMGVANGYLFLLVPNIIPVTLAHVAFLLFLVGPLSPTRKAKESLGFKYA